MWEEKAAHPDQRPSRDKLHLKGETHERKLLYVG